MNEPCRLCGSEPTLATYYDFYVFHCPTPGCPYHLGGWKVANGKGKWYGSIDDAREAWNQRQRRGETPSAPETVEPEQMPAEADDEPQNGLECDTREKLERDIKAEYYMLADEELEPIFGWLDRQAAITERETRLRELYRFEENHRANIDATEEVNRKLNERIAELTAECDRLQERNDRQGETIDKLKAERDELKAKLETYEKVPDQGEREEFQSVESGDTREKLEADVQKLFRGYAFADHLDTRTIEFLDRQAAITGREYWHNCCQNHVDYDEEYLPTVHEFEDKIAELTAERDQFIDERDCMAGRVLDLNAECDDLRDRLKTQANSFQKLERDNAKLRDTLARVRELLGGDAE